MSTKNHLRIRALTEGAMLVAAAQVLSLLKLYEFPQGGSVTAAMFPVLLYAVRWGLGRGLLISFAYGTLDMLLGKGYAWGWQSILLDYLVAYTALGLGGFFKGKAWGIFPGITLGCLGRFLIHHISGITLYRIVEPTGIEGLEFFGVFANPHLYSLVYNGVYMVPNTIIALAIAGLLYVPMKKYFEGSDLRK